MCYLGRKILFAQDKNASDLLLKEVQINAQNLSTQKASEKKGAWLQKENEDIRRQSCSQETSCKGQKETYPLIKFL